MLSLASNISSTQAVESKYSGVFDGTDEKIDCGASNNVVANGASEVSVMFWIKTTTSETNKYIFSIKRDNPTPSSAFSCRINNNKASAVIYTGSGHTAPESTTSINDGNWHHVAITGKASLQKIYVDGDLEDTHTDAFDMDIDTNTFTIGDHDGSKFIEMNLSSLAVFNTELDLNNVQAAYNGGGDFNLTFNQGNYNSSSNLTAYYRMGNGFFDDKANGIVHDQDNPGFGGDLISNGDFSNDLTGWDSSNATIVNGAVKLDNTGDGAIAFIATNSSVASYGDKDIHKIVYDVVATNGQTLTIEGDTNNDLETDTVGTDRVTYFRFNKSTGKLIIKRKSSGTNVTIDNIRLYKLNGNPGVTSGGVTFSSDTP